MYFILLITVLITAVFLVVAAFVIAKLMGPRTYKRAVRVWYTYSRVFMDTCTRGLLSFRNPFPRVRRGDGFPLSVGRRC